MNAIFFALLLVVCTCAAQAQYELFYSPADSVLCVTRDSLENAAILFRFRNGGSRIERASSYVTGSLITVDGIPGHLYSRWVPLNLPIPHVDSRSTDGGETWEPIQGLPYPAFLWTERARGWCGDTPGQSQTLHDNWFYTTSDSWQTYDSVLMNRYAEDVHDSVSVFSMSYRTGLLYGFAYHTDSLCVSSDSGQSWTTGGRPPQVATRIGAPDELWGHSWASVFWLATDTGRTVVNPLFWAHPPERPYNWDFELQPTNLPGEAFVLASINWWTDPYLTEFYLYHIQDYGADVDSFYYRLEDFQIVDQAAPVSPPRTYGLTAYPNPFNSQTEIRFDLPQTAHVELKVYNTFGQTVATLADGIRTAGTYRIAWDASHAASGVYICQLNAGNFTDTRKMVLLK